MWNDITWWELWNVVKMRTNTSKLAYLWCLLTHTLEDDTKDGYSVFYKHLVCKKCWKRFWWE